MLHDNQQQLLMALTRCYHDCGGNPVRLSSGTYSQEYIDVKYLLMESRTLNLACEWIETTYLNGRSSSYVGGPSIPAALIVGGLLARDKEQKLSGFVIRDKPKGHGLDKVIEGVIPPRGRGVCLVEDVITTGSSILTAAKIIERTGCKVEEIFALVDRQVGGVETLSEMGYVVHVFTTLGTLKKSISALQ